MVIHAAAVADLVHLIDVRRQGLAQERDLLRRVALPFVGHGFAEGGDLAREGSDGVVATLLVAEVADGLEARDAFAVEPVGSELEDDLEAGAGVAAHFFEEGLAEAVVGEEGQFAGRDGFVEAGFCLRNARLDFGVDVEVEDFGQFEVRAGFGRGVVLIVQEGAVHVLIQADGRTAVESRVFTVEAGVFIRDDELHGLVTESIRAVAVPELVCSLQACPWDSVIKTNDGSGRFDFA